MINIIGFDADDTLWHNENLFLETQQKFKQLLLGYHDEQWIDQRLYETEIKNLTHFGYGVKGFTLSMIETAIELTEGRIVGSEIQEIVDFARDMIDAPIEVLDHVQDTLKGLSDSHRLMVITKGDLLDQETKIARSGLGDYFQHVEVVSAKTPESYQSVFKKYDIAVDNFIMVGNSLKSDILPVLQCGAQAVHVPYETTWAHEEVPEKDLWTQGYLEVEHIGQLPELLKNLPISK